MRKGREDDAAGQDEDSQPLAEQGTPEVPLSPSLQTRNVAIFATNWAIIYLCSPVTYVGVLQAGLLNKLGFDDTRANLPAGVFLWSMPLSVLVAWAWPQMRVAKSLLTIGFGTAAALGLVVGMATLRLGPNAVLSALVVHAAVWGCANGVIASCQWEILGRGVSESRRGQALGVAFGFGPILAVVSSLGAQALLGGKESIIALPTIVYPWNFALLYLLSVPALAAGAIGSRFFVVPKPVVEPEREPFLSGVFGGAGDFFRDRVTGLAVIAYVMVYSGHEVLQNVALNAGLVLGDSPEKYAGIQLALRFGFKIAAGFALGWLLSKTNPRLLLTTTAGLTALGVTWALFAPGRAYLAAFGVLGAGELFGVYYFNYILDCSPKHRVRRNMSMIMLATLVIGFAPVMYGWIADRAGYRASFATSLAILGATMALTSTMLPKRPTRRESGSGRGR